MNIARLLLRGAEIAAATDAPAIAQGPVPLYGYPALIQRVRRLASGLSMRGVAPGDRVAVFMENRAEYFDLLLATWWIGAVAVPINAKLAPAELTVILDDAEPALVFTTMPLPDAIVVGTPEYAALMDHEPAPEAPHPVDSHAIAWLFYTSGTTGRPKGAMIHHGSLLAMTQGFLTDVDALPAGTPMLHLAPLSHGSGLYALPCFAVGGVQVLPRIPGFRPAEIATLTARWPGACFFAAPTMVRRLVQEVTSTGIAPDGLRTIVYGGGPLYPGDARAAGDALGPVFAQIYGQGECPMTITAQSRSDFSAALARGDDAFLQAVGRPFLGGEVRIVDAAEKPLASGEVGEIIVRGRAMCLGYWKDQAATTRTFGGGWLRTGDLGRMDDTGMVTLAGRSKEVIITGGSNVYPIEVEAVLLDHPDVQEAAVIGVAHPDWGEAVTAYVTSNRDDGELMTELDALCRDRIARFKCPKTYHIRDALPKNAYGKIVKRDLA